MRLIMYTLRAALSNTFASLSLFFSLIYFTVELIRDIGVYRSFQICHIGQSYVISAVEPPSTDSVD